jgi:hypothetical protein
VNSINPEVLMGAAKPLIPIIASMLAHWGFGTDAQNTVMVGAVFSALMAVWAGLNNTQTAKIASVNSTDNGVKVVASTTNAPQVNAPLK